MSTDEFAMARPEPEPEPEPPATIGGEHPADEWTVVSRRTGKAKGRKRGRKRLQSAHTHSPGGAAAGVPAVQVQASRAALASDPAGEQEIQRAVIQMRRSVESMESSAVAQYAVEMIQKLEAPQEIVCYGIGDVVNSRIARLQLALALFIAENIRLDPAAVSFYDPVLTHGGASVLGRLGVTVTQENEHCRRRVPDGMHLLFFMPHCDRDMYNNVIGANLIHTNSNSGSPSRSDSGRLAEAETVTDAKGNGVSVYTDRGSTIKSSNFACTNLSIFGNSFSAYEERAPYDEALQQCEYLLLAASKCVEQPLLDPGEEFGPGVFNDTALHTFP